jgi:hypothetical protein
MLRSPRGDPRERTTDVDALGVVINATVMVGVGLALWWVFRGRFRAMDARLGRFEERMGRFEDRIERRLDRFESRMDRLEVSIDAVRSDLTAVALAVGARPQAGRAGGR